MNKKQILVTIALAAMVLISGCSVLDEEPDGESLDESTNANVSNTEVGESYHWEVKFTEENQMRLVQENPPPTMDNSLERQNLIQRYEYLNDQNNVHHIYLLSHDGKVVHYSVAQGKVSSVNSKLTNDRQIVRAENCNGNHDKGDACWKTVESPQMDGSYGENGDAIFWFTTDGHYMEWNGLYVVSEEPKDIRSEVTLVDVVEEEGSSGNETEG